jgi:hypothetical protein
VSFNDKLISHITPSGYEKKTVEFIVEAVDGNNILSFRDKNTKKVSMGAVIDNVGLFPACKRTTPQASPSTSAAGVSEVNPPATNAQCPLVSEQISCTSNVGVINDAEINWK